MGKEFDTKEAVVDYYTEIVAAKEAEIKRLKEDNLVLTKTLLKSEDKMRQMAERLQQLKKDS